MLLFLGWNAPNHYPPWPTFHVELFSALGLGCLSLAVLAFPTRAAHDTSHSAKAIALGDARLAAPLPVRLWMCAALLPLVQYGFGQIGYRGDALIGLLYGLGIALAVYVGVLWSAQQGREQVVKALLLTFVAAGLAANALALVQWFRLDAPAWWAMELIDDRPFANLGQPNHFGLLMVMAIVAATTLFETRALVHRWTLGLAVMFLGIGVLISQSRASMLALLLVALFWLVIRRRSASRLRLLDVGLAVGAWLLLSQAVAPLQQLLLLQAPESRAVAEVGPRQWIWLHFWTAIQEHPWLGHGFNQSVRAMAEVAPQVHPSRNVIYAHNLLLDLMTWVGIPLAVFLSLALVWWLLGLIRKTPDPMQMAERHGVFAICLALLVQSMLEFPFAHAYFLLPAALLAGAVMSSPPPAAAPDSAVTVRATPSMVLISGAAAVLLALTSWEYFQLERDFRNSRFAHANFGAQPEQDHDRFQSPWVLDQLAALNASSAIKIAPQMSAQDLQMLRSLARRFHMLSTRMDYAKALALNGQLEQAEAELQIIRSVSPASRFARIESEWKAWLRSNKLAAGGTAETAGRQQQSR